jgi:hypothetical protein
VFRFVRVQGVSMSPTLADGDFVLVVSGFVRPGVIALVAHDALGVMLKRVVRRDASGQVELRGDGPLSITREHLGWVPARALRGRAVLRVSRHGVHWLASRHTAPT